MDGKERLAREGAICRERNVARRPDPNDLIDKLYCGIGVMKHSNSEEAGFLAYMT
ncbi:MAG: hypothetical protein NC238_16340 [Dehalobacter sp.]|nr:hypothetical protein [Dehalobacter sp.]